jgi:hypothetical protein
VLATRLNRLLTLTFSRSSGFKNMQPKILYFLQAKTGQSHTMCTLSSFSYPHSQHSCLSVCPSLCKCALRLVWPVNSPTAALSLNLFMARNSLALLGRRYLIKTLDCRYPVQVEPCLVPLLMRAKLPVFKYASNSWHKTKKEILKRNVNIKLL